MNTKHKFNRMFANILSVVAILVIAFPAMESVSAQELTPTVRISTSNNYLQADDFTPYAKVTFTVYASQDSPDVILEISRDADETGHVFIDGWEHEADLMAGNYVVATDDTGNEKQLVLEPLTIEIFNTVTDLVAGTALPGTYVWVVVGNDFGYPADMGVEANADGIWIADFDYDFSDDMWGSAVVSDEDWDATVYHLGPTPPAFIAVSLTSHWFMANNFLPETPITFYIYESKGDVDPVYVIDLNTDEFGNVGTQGWEYLWNPEMGNYVVATDGVNIKELELEYVTLDVFDPYNDFLSGEAAYSGRQVDIGVGNENGEQWMSVIADDDSRWSADFTLPDYEFNITADSWAGAHVSDEDGDVTASHNSGPPEPPAWFTAFPEQDVIEGWDWPLGAELHMSIDDPSTEVSPDYEQSETVEYAPWGSGQLWVWFEFPEAYDMKPGDVVTLSDGLVERTHVVRNLTITSIAFKQNTVTGTSDANESINLWSWEDPEGAQLRTNANNKGIWRADFDDIGFDLVPGYHVRAEVWDDTGNDTAVDWYVHPNYTGLWRAIDSADDSNMQMTISGGGNNRYQLTWSDDYWSICGGPGGNGLGTGVLTPWDMLQVNWVIKCHGAVVWEGQLDYMMDLETGTLWDGANTWFLVGSP